MEKKEKETQTGTPVQGLLDWKTFVAVFNYVCAKKK